MRVALITPAPPRARNGNRNTATRWAAFLRAMNHSVTLEREWSGARADLMVALHARRSHDSIRRYADACPESPLIVALTGTDVYRDIRTDVHAQLSLKLATRLIVLQSWALRELAPTVRLKTRVIYQSARSVPRPPALTSCFEVVVSGHLREEKDPFRAVAALHFLPEGSRIRVTHIGAAMSSEMAAEAQAWMSRESRYRWLGEIPHWKALRILGRGRLLVISSRMEGGANVVSEALTLGVPIVASRISGNLGMLGARYPGYYPLGDERALAQVLFRAESETKYYRRLARASAERAPLVSAARERAGLAALVREVTARKPRTRKGRNTRL